MGVKLYRLGKTNNIEMSEVSASSWKGYLKQGWYLSPEQIPKKVEPKKVEPKKVGPKKPLNRSFKLKKSKEK